MKVITYLGFTLLSIFIQFCVMDFIQEKFLVGKDTVKINVTSREHFNDLIKNISSKPHALYYRALMGRSQKNTSPSKVYNNSSMTEIPLGTTDATTTIFDVLYDENTSETEASSTTESYFTSTEFDDNITEITFFEVKNKSSNFPSLKPKINSNNYCQCNLLYKVCDINCCCDEDCSELEYSLFQCDNDKAMTEIQSKPSIEGCISNLFEIQRYGSNILDNLFCVVKTNLPSKRNVKKYTAAPIKGQFFKWHNGNQKQRLYEFKKTLYKLADPVWLLKNGTIYYLDFPAPMVNNYCSDRVPIAFLKDEKIRCNVKLNDLEMINILRTSEEAMIISATDTTLNSSVVNCSNLYCINWTILACENGVCLNYNKSLNEASCTDSICTNVALKIDYEFYYYDLKIINATIKLHIQNISHTLPFMLQEINVNFFMANRSIDKVIELSGNPGYIAGLAVIVSYAENNHTANFYNNTLKSRLILPENKYGMCVESDKSTNIVTFGMNSRRKCRYSYPQGTLPKDKRKVCKNIQNDIIELLQLNSNVSVSPFGNPNDITDDNWINLQLNMNIQEPVYGEYNENTLQLHCHNVINRVSVIFMYANVDENVYTGQNKIISAKYDVAATNLSFKIDDISTVITIDVNFMDLSKPSIIEYAGGPQLNIHLPKDFFFPFPSNNCHHVSNSHIVTIYCVILFFANKITLE